MSVAIENFVKAIYKNGKRDHNDTKPGNIAKELGISNAAATDMAKKLATKDLLHYEKYQELKLTDKGTKMALNVNTAFGKHFYLNFLICRYTIFTVKPNC